MKKSAVSKKGAGTWNLTPYKILLPLMVFAGGCASYSEPVYLYDVYNEYSQRLDVKDYDYIMDEALSSSMNNRGLDDPDQFRDYYPVLSELPGLLKEKTTHYELSDGYRGCLTLNGFDRLERPAVIKMEFKREQSSWKLDYVSVDYVDSPVKFVETAVCPKRRA
ncbi:hypothetical protein QQM79_03485 [Marinobacteraceae bacterium S3BR75-40.1]